MEQSPKNGTLEASSYRLLSDRRLMTKSPLALPEGLQMDSSYFWPASA